MSTSNIESKTKYQALDCDEESDLSPEYDPDVDGGRDRHRSRSNGRHKETSAKVARYRNWLLFLSTVYATTAIFGFLAFRSCVNSHNHDEVAPSRDSPECSKETLYPYLAEIPTTIVTFQPDKRFWTEVPVKAAEGPWSEIMPLGRGFVNLTRGQAQYAPDLHRGHSDDEIVTYGLAVYHGIHCLASIRATMASLNASIASDPDHEHNIDPDHISHCFDYIRQSIMCSGDMTLESNPFVNKEKILAVDGWGVQHKCRDWDTMWEFTTTHRMSDKGGAL